MNSYSPTTGRNKDKNTSLDKANRFAQIINGGKTPWSRAFDNMRGLITELSKDSVSPNIRQDTIDTILKAHGTWLKKEMPEMCDRLTELKFIVVHTTERGFRKGEFRDLRGAACSLQESSLATAGAIWLGLDQMTEEYESMPHRMHLSKDEFNIFLTALEDFARNGVVPQEPITTCDRYGIPCILSAASDNEISFGIVLPKLIGTLSTQNHDYNMYANPGDDIRFLVDELFKKIKIGDLSSVDIDNRMQLNQSQVGTLLVRCTFMLNACEELSIV